MRVAKIQRWSLFGQSRPSFCNWMDVAYGLIASNARRAWGPPDSIWASGRSGSHGAGNVILTLKGDGVNRVLFSVALGDGRKSDSFFKDGPGMSRSAAISCQEC